MDDLLGGVSHRRAQDAPTALWHDDVDDDLRGTLAGALVAFHDPDLRALLAQHRDSADPHTRRLCGHGIERLDQDDPAARRIYSGPELHGLASGYDDGYLAILLHGELTNSDPYWERPHPRESDIANVLRFGHRERVPGENIVRITGRAAHEA